MTNDIVDDYDDDDIGQDYDDDNDAAVAGGKSKYFYVEHNMLY